MQIRKRLPLRAALLVSSDKLVRESLLFVSPVKFAGIDSIAIAIASTAGIVTVGSGIVIERRSSYRDA